MQAAKQQFPANKLGVLSFSISTLLATLAFQKEPFDFLIGEGYVSDPIAIVSYWKREANQVFVLPTSSKTYLNAVSKISCPMLLLAGAKDEITPLASILKITSQRSNRTLLSYEGGHLQGTQIWQEKNFADGYVRRIKEFVEKT